MIRIRRAVPADAAAMSAVLIASITELCVEDHRNDAEILAKWLANKTPDGIRHWIGNAQNTLLVADRDGELAAVGGFNRAREIIVNYVAPVHRFAGVSKAVLSALEAGLGPGEASLSSTRTAHRFYLDAGWQDAGDLYAGRFIDAFPMHKLLT